MPEAVFLRICLIGWRKGRRREPKQLRKSQMDLGLILFVLFSCLFNFVFRSVRQKHNTCLAYFWNAIFKDCWTIHFWNYFEIRFKRISAKTVFELFLKYKFQGLLNNQLLKLFWNPVLKDFCNNYCWTVFEIQLSRIVEQSFFETIFKSGFKGFLQTRLFNRFCNTMFKDCWTIHFWNYFEIWF